jgi:hypothetical protein
VGSTTEAAERKKGGCRRTTAAGTETRAGKDSATVGERVAETDTQVEIETEVEIEAQLQTWTEALWRMGAPRGS